MKINVIESLITKYSPNDVEYKELGDLGVFENIGVDKKILPNEKLVKLLNYMDVYKNHYIDASIPSMTVSASDKKIFQCSVEKGDIFITPTSETKGDIGHSAVIIETIENCCYSYHLMRYRLNQSNIITSFYIRYLFECDFVRKQIYKYAKGLTRYGLSKYDFVRIIVPLPPLPVQEEIVRILDAFFAAETELEVKLKAEQDFRKKQYKYHLNQLLSFDKKDKSVKFMQLGEIGTFIKGNGLQKKDFTDSGVGCIHYGQIYTYYGTYTQQTKSFVSEELAKKLKKAQKGDLIIATTSENVEDVGKAVAWLGNESICIGGHSTVFHHNQNPKYMAYLFQTEIFFKQKQKVAKGVKVIDISDKAMSKFKFGFPSIEEQERIVSILDELNKLINEISDSLQAEITARKKQYEYYRNKLLTFKEAV